MKLLHTYFLFAILTLLTGLSANGAVEKPVEWNVTVEKISETEGVVYATANIIPGWHVYGTVVGEGERMPPATTLTIEPVEGLEIIDADQPAQCSQEPTYHFDESLGIELPWLSDTFKLSRRFKLTDGAEGVILRGEVRYMACTENNCTPPTRYDFSLPFGSVEEEKPNENTLENVVETKAPTNSKEGSIIDEWWAPVEDSASHSEQSNWLILIFGFLGGLVALLTPCVWPMIPMTMSFFLKGKKEKKKGLRDAIIYALSIIVIFVTLGLVTTLIFGPGKLNEIATGAVFNLIFFAILVIFGLSFLGAFEIRLPSKWSTAIDAKAETTSGFLSIFLMAGTLVVVSFSCTGPIIGTLLVEAFSEGKILGPLLGMGGFALGLALPFGIFAVFPSLIKEMPRSGSWLNTVKVVLGFIELILSLKFLSVADLAYGWHLLDREIFLAIWIVLFALLGLYLIGKLRFEHDDVSDGSSKTGIVRFIFAVASFSFAIYLLPGMWGAPLKGISAFAPPLYTQDFNLYGGEFHEYDDYEGGMRLAKERGVPVLIDFSGYGCVNCRKMEGAVFDSPAVRAMIEDNFLMIKLMVDDKTSLPTPVVVEENGEQITLKTVGERWSYLERYKFGVNSQPYYVMLDNHGRMLGPSRSYNESVDAFLEWLQSGIEQYKSRK